MLSSFRSFTERVESLGLSNGLFCNSSNYAAKLTAGQIVTRRVGDQPEYNPVNIEKARAKVAKAGYNGKMSNRTRANVVGMLAEWFTAIKSEHGPAFTTANAAARRFTFVTLTLCAAQMHTDNYLKRHALGRFIQDCERHCGLTDYFWRAEPQNNGNIHFHLLLSVEIPWQQVHGFWLAIMKDLGYLELYTAKMYNRYAGGFRPSSNENDKRSIEKQVEAYRKGVECKWTKPNCTDIHRLNKTKNAAAYVCKYVSKDEGSRKIDGRIWGCSDSLRQLKTPQLRVSEDFLRLMQEAAESGAVKLVQLEHVAVYQGDIRTLLKVLVPELLIHLEQHYSDISGWLRNLRGGSIPPTPK